ncbi:MAG: hypothetical protein IH591_18265 [Bacteroidales bacterium]|nr:hypothetical protein [Bacteroidales bacterium]
MRSVFLFILLMVPLISMAQISNDGKSGTSNKIIPQTSNKFSILFSGSTNAPFGVRVLYSEIFGGYVAFKSNFDLTRENHYDISVGAAKMILNNLVLYLGGGVDLGYHEDVWDASYDSGYYRDFGVLFETGTIIKTRVLTYELGFGTGIAKYHDFSKYSDEVRERFFVNFGIGYSF